MWVTHFKHRSLHKYTRVARVQDGVEIKGIIDLVQVKRDMLKYVQDVRGMERGIPDHSVVPCTMKLVGT